jgi:hypothetical protein
MMNICQVCNKGISDGEPFQTLTLERSDDAGQQVIMKHVNCGPIIKCYRTGCRKEILNGENILAVDVRIGEPVFKRLVFVNYCSDECREKDDYDLDECFELLMESRGEHTMSLWQNGAATQVKLLY